MTETALHEQSNRSGLRVRLAAGTELLGQWEGSALEVPTYLIRRPDGQHVHVSALLYRLAACLETPAGPPELAAQLSDSTGREVSAENVTHLLRTKLAPLGILTCDDRPVAPLRRANALLALRFRFAVVPARVHRRVTTALTFLFRPPVIALALAGLAAADIWIGVDHGPGVLTGVNQMIAHPALLLALTLMTLTAAVIHEIGHATATRAGGATPGVMGAGVYLVWPVFYTDITDSYRLGRAGRLRADLGGVYFNALTILAAAIAYGTTHWALLLVFVAVMHVEVLSQFLPFVRLDGYWVVSDLIGVPNLFAYLGPTLARILRRSTAATEARLARIKPWARKVITVWVIATAVVLGANLSMALWLGPRLVARTIVAFGSRSEQLGAAWGHGRLVVGANDVFSILFLTLPAVGITYIGVVLVIRLVGAAIRSRRTHPVAAVLCAAALVGLAAYQTYAVAGSYRTPPPRPAAGAPAAHATAGPAAGPAVSAATAAAEPDTAHAPNRSGTWTVRPDGSVATTGRARFFGSASDIGLAAPTVAIAATPDGAGYWLAGADGGVFAYGDARFYGSVADLRLDGPVVAISATADGRGYWMTATDGGVFAFGDAGFFGSLGGGPLATSIVGMAPVPDGQGYWLAGTDGRVFAFGTAASQATAAPATAAPATAAPARAGAGRVPDSGRPVTAITPTAAGYQIETPAGPRSFTAVTDLTGPSVRSGPRGTVVQVTNASGGGHSRSP